MNKEWAPLTARRASRTADSASFGAAEGRAAADAGARSGSGQPATSAFALASLGLSEGHQAIPSYILLRCMDDDSYCMGAVVFASCSGYPLLGHRS